MFTEQVKRTLYTHLFPSSILSAKLQKSAKGRSPITF